MKVKICCMCSIPNKNVVFFDTKTKEYLCEEHGITNYSIYLQKGIKPKMVKIL